MTKITMNESSPLQKLKFLKILTINKKNSNFQVGT